MDQKNRRRVRGRLFGFFACLALGVMLLAACGNGGTGNTNNGATGSVNTVGLTNATPTTTTQTSAMGTVSSAACDQITRVIMSGPTGQAKQYTFTPSQVTIKAGQFIRFDNRSDEIHALQTAPNAELAASVIYRNEDQPVQFTKAGTYTVESQDAKHRGSMQVTVTSATGTTCGISSSVTTVTFTGKHAVEGQADAYMLAPKMVSLNAGQSLTLLNKTDQTLNFSCKPEADITEGNLRVDTNEQQVVAFAKAGQYVCTSTESPKERLSVTVR